MKETLAPSVTTRDSKGLKLLSIVEAAYNKAGLSDEEAQRVNDTPGLAELIGDFIAESRCGNQYADEEVETQFDYPPEYAGPKPIDEQIKVLVEIFDLDSAQALEYAKNLPELPEGAEGWFAIPSVSALAKRFFPEVADPAEQYCCAVQLVHEKLGDSRKFFNYRDGQITSEHLRVHTRTAQALDLIAEKQPGDIIVIAGQLGKLHAGESVRRARELFKANEFGLGALAVCSIALTHPERFVRWEQLHADCAGDEFGSNADGDFDKAPYLIFRGGGVGFNTDHVSNSNERFGAVSAFGPQQS